MRIRELHIDSWRCFRDVHRPIPQDARLVCLVGENGTGKSSILHLLRIAGASIGLDSFSWDSRRDLPRGERFRVVFDLELGADQLGRFFDHYSSGTTKGQADRLGSLATAWDGTLVVEWDGDWGDPSSFDGPVVSVTAGRIPDLKDARWFAFAAIERIRGYPGPLGLLALGPDRWYSGRNREEGERLGRSGNAAWQGREAPNLPTNQMATSWISSFIAKHRTDKEAHEKEILAAYYAKKQPPEPPPAPRPYEGGTEELLRRLLPHMGYDSLETSTQDLIFEAAGNPVIFEDLSSGEKEIAFHLDYLARFRRPETLLLIDEPELHLNRDLLLSWLEHLAAGVQRGQLWLATHSYDVAEFAGADATFLLNRSARTGPVIDVIRWADQPGFATLAASLGVPAFSLSRRPFVFIEGKRADEPKRFVAACGAIGSRVRFVPTGGWQTVRSRTLAVADFAKETDGELRVGGIVDRDFRTNGEIATLIAEGLHVLGVHEVENLFLHPEALQCLLPPAERSVTRAIDLVRQAADKCAGGWIVDRTRAVYDVEGEAIGFQRINAFEWPYFAAAIAGGSATIAADIVRPDAMPSADELGRAVSAVTESIEIYGLERQKPTLWKTCTGKQVLANIAGLWRSGKVPAVIGEVADRWASNNPAPPPEVVGLRDYVLRLSEAPW